MKPLNNFIEISVCFTTGFEHDTHALGTQLDCVLCSKGCWQCWEQCWLLGSAVTPWSSRHTASLEGPFVSQLGSKASKSERGLCPLSEGDLRAPTACQPPGQWSGSTEPFAALGTALPLAGEGTAPWSRDNDTGLF